MKDEPIRFNPHHVVWDNDKIARVWNFYSSMENDYFSQAAGDSLLDHVRRKVPLRGKALDYGCGAGHFIEKLLARRIPTAAYDLSEESLKIVADKFHAHPFFLGAIHSAGLPTPIPEDAYNAVFFIETIEHLLPEEAGPVLRELHRITKRGGHVIVTTRNEEDMARKEVQCPDCGAIFHRKQHLTAFSAPSLALTMSEGGFSGLYCRPVMFSVSRLSGLRQVYARVRGEKLPSLLYIGRKG